VSVKKLARVSFLENYTFVYLAIMSGVKSGAQGQLNGFTGDAGGNRLKKDAMSGRDLVPFFPDAETVAQSEKQNGNSVKVKVSRTNGTPAPSIPHILLTSLSRNVSRRVSSSGPSHAPCLSLRRVICRHDIGHTSLPVSFSPARRRFFRHFSVQLRRSLPKIFDCCHAAQANAIELHQS
jgi:hypothetical protein